MVTKAYPRSHTELVVNKRLWGFGGRGGISDQRQPVLGMVSAFCLLVFVLNTNCSVLEGAS